MDDQIQSGGQAGAGSFLRPFLAGGLICLLFGVVQATVTKWVSSNGWSGWPVGVAFVLLAVQCFVISFFTGRQLVANRNLVWAWTFFYVWCLLMINLTLGHVLIESGIGWASTYWQLSMVFAFLQAQMGLMIIWGVLGSYDWRKRLPLFAIGFGCFCFPLWMFDFRSWSMRGWFSLLICYLVAVFVTTLILRWFRFRITALQFDTDLERAKNPQGQFSVLNLFVWTTIAAAAVGVGRFVPWELVWESVWAREVRFAILVSILVTVIAVSTCWAALGEPKGKKYVAVLVRLVIMLLLFTLIAYGLYSSEAVAAGGARGRTGSFIGGWAINLNTQGHLVFGIWCAWTVLNGFFLFGLLQVFGAAGCRLVRKPKHAVDV